jgi:hypothetical protein
MVRAHLVKCTDDKEKKKRPAHFMADAEGILFGADV